jgi:tetratricopeptide (TPR) repeat protein
VRRMGKGTPAMLWTLGDIYVNQGLWGPAWLAYSQAMDSEPAQGVQRPLRAAEALAQRAAYPQARQLLAKIKDSDGASLDPADRRRILRLEAQVASADGDGKGAAAILEEMVALDPLDGEALLLLGQHYARNGEPDRAIFYYERAEGIEAFEAEARLRHAQLLVARSSYSEALPLLKRSQEIRPREDVARYLEQVERFARSQR